LIAVMNKTNKNLIILTIIIVAMFGAIYQFYPIKLQLSVGKYDEFAKCLAIKRTIMYGADWCPHCQNEKKAFGDSFRFVPYVECPLEPKQCLDAGIKVYPTWIFSDGRKLVGEQGLKKLSEVSGCQL